MPFPILAEADLPAIGTTCERSDVDFKTGVNPKDEIELAKDVAALANTVGGSVVIGASTQGSRLTGYPGLAASLASVIPDAYEKAAKDRCRPAPKLASQVTSTSSSNASVVVINVWPAALAPIGISISQQVSGAILR
jgi:predicted HTH transcriptional regulator